MHFSTASAEPAGRALLESRWLYPKPGAQCLQFFLHNTAAADDVLNIWVREYDGVNPRGKLNLFKRISGTRRNLNPILQYINKRVINVSNAYSDCPLYRRGHGLLGAP